MQLIIQFMKRNYKILLFLIVLTGVLVSFNLRYQPDPEKDKALISVLRHILTQGHYQPTDLNDNFSEAVFDNFLEMLDPSKHYFLEEDLTAFSPYKTTIDDQILQNDLSFFYTVYDTYKNRLNETKNYYKEILKKPLDLTKEDTYSIDYKKSEYPKDREALRKVWEKQLKMRLLGTLYDKEEAEKDKVKTDSTYVVKSFEVLKEEAQETVLDNMDNLYERIDELNQDDWFGFYLNSITSQFGPHTSYLDPKIKKKFDISIPHSSSF